MAAQTTGRALRDADGSARRLLHHLPGHQPAALAVLAVPGGGFVVQAFALEPLPPATVERLDELKQAIYAELARDHDQAEELEFKDGSGLQ